MPTSKLASAPTTSRQLDQERTSLQEAPSHTLRPAIACYPETAQHVIGARASLVAQHAVQLM